MLPADTVPVDWPQSSFGKQREKVPDDYSVVDPEHKLIYRFIRMLFSSAQLTAECAIVTLVSRSGSAAGDAFSQSHSC